MKQALGAGHLVGTRSNPTLTLPIIIILLLDIIFREELDIVVKLRHGFPLKTRIDQLDDIDAKIERRVDLDVVLVGSDLTSYVAAEESSNQKSGSESNQPSH